jgi:flagellar protein FlaF
MYEFSYNEVVDDSRQVMRARERGAMDRVIVMLRGARDRGSNSRELRNPENELPEQLRAGIVSIGIWMNKEIDRFRTGQTSDLTPIIEINEIIRDGLK